MTKIPDESSIWVDSTGAHYRVVFAAKAIRPALRDQVWIIYQKLGSRDCLAESLPEWLERMQPQ